MDESQRLFSNKDLVRLCWPLIIEQLLNVLVGMVDVLMVASLGEAAVSGVSLVDTINILLIQMLAALATGGAVVCSQMLGRKDIESANRAAGQLLILTVAATCAVSMLSIGFSRSILHLIFGSVEPAVMNNAILYFRLTALSYPFLAMFNSTAALFRTMGNSRISMHNSLVMNGINVIGNFICIFILHMGVEGVAIPTLLSRAIVAVIMVVKLISGKGAICPDSLRQYKPNGEYMRRILHIGIPTGLENGMFHFGKVMLSGLVSSLGTASIAGYAVAGNLVTFLYLSGNALGLGLLTVTGRCVGAGLYAQAKHYARLFLKANYVILAVISISMGVFRYRIIALYALSPEATTIAAGMFLSHCIAMILWPPAFLLPNALRAANDVRFTMCVSILVMWIFRVGLAYVFIKVLHLSVYYVWYAMFIDWVVRVIVYLKRFGKFEQIAGSKTA